MNLLLPVNNKFRYIISYISSLYLAALLSIWLIPRVEVSADTIKDTLTKYPLIPSQVKPEPYEFQRYVFFWIFFVILFCVIYMFLHKMRIKSRLEKMIAIGLSATSLAIIVYCVFLNESDHFWTVNSWFSGNIVICAILVVSCWLIDSYFARHAYNKKIKVLFNIVCFSIICITVFVCYMPNPFFNTTNLFHESCYFTSIYNVNYGATIGVEIESIYGSQAYLFLPGFSIWGFSLNNFAIIITLLCATIFTGWYFIIKQVIKQPFHIFVSLCLLLYTSIYLAIPSHFSQFLNQHLPHRVIFPVLTLCYVIYVIKKPSNFGVKKALGFCLCTVALMCNIESGLACIGTLLATMTFVDLSNYSLKNKNIWKNLLFNTAMACLSIVVFFCLIIFIAFVRTGKIIDLISVYSTQYTFALLGYGMLPQPSSLNIYMLVYAMLGCSVTYCLSEVIHRQMSESSLATTDSQGNEKISIENPIIFAVSVMGICLLLYYTGRSHNRTLLPILWPTLIVLCWGVAKLISIIKENSPHHENYIVAIKIITLPLAAIIIVFALSIPFVITKSDDFKKYLNAQISGEVSEAMMQDFDFILSNENNGTVNLIGKYASPILAHLNLRNSFLGEMPSDWFTYDAYDFALKYIQTLNENLIMDTEALYRFNTFSKEKFVSVMEEAGYVESKKVGDYVLFIQQNSR